MRQHLSLVLTAAFLFLSQGATASTINTDDDNMKVDLENYSVTAQASDSISPWMSAMSSTSDDLQCYRKINGQLEPLFDKTGKWLDPRIPVGNPSVPSVMDLSSSQDSDALGIVTSTAAFAPDQPDTRSLIQKTRQPGNITGLHLHAQTEILWWLDAAPVGRNNLLQTCRYYRAFVMPIMGEMHPISNQLRQELRETIASGYYLQCFRIKGTRKIPLFDDAGKLLDQRAQEPRSEPTMTSVEKNGKLLWTNILSGLAHYVRVEILEFLQDDSRGQLSLMHVSHGFRGLALVLPERSNNTACTGNALKKHLLTALIGGQTGDLDLFMKDGQLKALQTLSLPDLQDAFASRHYTGTLSETTKHGKTYRSIGSKVAPCFDGHLLDLRKQNLRLVPLNFPEASTILRLYLQENQLRVVPDLSQLPKMWRLDLDSNQLKVVPDPSHLTNLQWLTLSNNQLSDVPGLSRLMNLNRLDLDHNQLRVVPGLSQLTKLKTLYLYGNQLTEVSDLSTLTGLTWLDISYNQLRVLPDLSQLTSLERLDLNNNRLTSLPDLSRLKNLWRLFLSNNPLTVVPDLSPLTDLTTLCMDAPLCQNETVLETLRMLNGSRGERDKISLYKSSTNASGKDVQEEVPLD